MIYTDRLNNPISVGDIAVYTAPSGTHSSVMRFGRVEQLIRLIEKPGHWLPTGPHSRTPFVREDRPHKSEFYVEEDAYGRPLPEKAYQAMVQPVRPDPLCDWVDVPGRRTTLSASQALVITKLVTP